MSNKSNFIVRGGMDCSGISKGFKKTEKDINSFQKSVSGSMKLVAATLGGVLTGAAVKDALSAYDESVIAETKLTTIMQQRMGATDEMVDSITQLSQAQQKIGVIEDDAQIAGAQQLATFLHTADALKTLIPSMNNLAAQQNGVKTTAESMTNIANMMGKVLEGNTGALTRVGISFSEAQEKVLKFGTEEERAAVLAQVITDNVGNMNEALANTDVGEAQQLANEFGNMKEEFGQAAAIVRADFVPALRWAVSLGTTVATKLQGVFSTIGSVVSTLFGSEQSSNMTAVTVGTEDASMAMEDYGDAVETAGKKADKALAPFDEIIKIGSATSEGISSGISVPGTSVVSSNDLSGTNEMTTAAERLTQVLSPTADALKNLWNAIEPFADKVGAGFSEFVDDVMEVGEDALTEWIPGGINFIASAISKMEPGDIELVGSALLGLGVAILTFKGMTTISKDIDCLKKSYGLFLGTLKAHPVMTIVSGLVGLAAATTAIAKAEFNASALGKYVDKIDDLVDSSQDLNQEIGIMLDNQKDRQEDIEAEYGAIEILADNYFALADQETLTNEQQVLMKSYAAELIKKIPELSDYIDEQTGAYKGTKDEIVDLISKTKDYYLLQAAQESLTEISKAQYEAEQSLSTLETTRQDILLTLAKLTEQYEIESAAALSTSRSLTEEQKQASLNALDLSGKINKLKGSLSDVDEQIGDTKQTQKDLNTQWNYATDYISKYSTTASSQMPIVESSVNSALGNIKKSVESFKLPHIKLGLEIDKNSLGGVKLDFNKGLQIEQYASGGLPETGDLFVADEVENEWVGHIGSQPAVANSDQIVEGIKQGVASGSAEEISLLKQQISILKAILNKTGISTRDIFDAGSFENDKQIKKSGRSRYAY